MSNYEKSHVFYFVIVVVRTQKLKILELSLGNLIENIFSRILLIQNAPEKLPIPSPPPTRRSRSRSTRGQVEARVEPPPATYHEEDESGGFDTYRGGLPALHRRASDSRRPPAVYHITLVDPLEVDIREMLALDARREARSLPNLRASRESLLPAPASAPDPAPAAEAAAPRPPS